MIIYSQDIKTSFSRTLISPPSKLATESMLLQSIAQMQSWENRYKDRHVAGDVCLFNDAAAVEQGN